MGRGKGGHETAKTPGDFSLFFGGFLIGKPLLGRGFGVKTTETQLFAGGLTRKPASQLRVGLIELKGQVLT